MGIKVKSEDIAWMEEFGILDQPIAARGAFIITFRSLLWITIGTLLIYKGINFPGPKIANIVSIYGTILYIPGAIFLIFGLFPSKSVKREIQFLFMIKLIITRLTQNSSKKSGTKKKKKKKVKTVKNSDVQKTPKISYKKRQIVEKKKTVKKKTKPVKIK